MAEPRITWIQAATVIDGEGSREADVLFCDGKVQAVGAVGDVPEGAEVVDGRGRILLPGLFDMNAHLREPGREDKEDMATGSAAAVQGGVTGLLAMPNTDPPVDNAGMVQSVTDLAAAKSPIPIFPAGCLTKGRAGTEMAAIGEMACLGVKLLTDDPSPVADAQLLRRLMEYAREFDLIVASHATTPALVQGGSVNEGEVGYFLGLGGMPSMAEEIAIFRDVAIARHTGCRLHIQHVSSARGLEVIRRAKEEGIPVTCEATPLHLIFDDSAVCGYDTRFKMDPPLRAAEDREALLEGLRNGTVDVIASNHAPHSAFEKNTDFASAPFGASLFDTLLPALHHHVLAGGGLSLEILVERFCLAPRRLLGLPEPGFREGAAVDAVLFNPAGETEVSQAFLKSRGCNNPFLGQTLQGRVEGVWLGSKSLMG